MALGLRSSWQLHEIRYVAWAGPALAVVAANGIVKLISIRPPWGWSLLAVLLVVQLTSLNWGKEDAFVGVRWRSLAKTIQTSSSSRVVVIGGGGIRAWFPAALIYELDPNVMVAILRPEVDLDKLAVEIERYDHVWMVCSPRDVIMSTTRPIEDRFLSRLEKSGGYKQIASYSPCPRCRPEWPAYLLQKL
jgi:hypothetical protein